MADTDKTLKLLIEMGVIGKDDVKAANDLLTDTTKANAVATGATAELGAEVAKTTEHYSAHRREVRAVFNELGQAAGVGRIGGLALGGIFAAATAAVEAIKFLGETWKGLKETISGPIDIGLPEDVSKRVNDAATAWNDYATARAKAVMAGSSPEANASAGEKRLTNELKLIKEVLTAEKEKALTDLEMQKGAMSPEAYKAAQDNIRSIFGEAETAAEAKNRQAKIGLKADEATNLEIDARNKTKQALGLKLETPETQKAWEKMDAAGEKAQGEIEERIKFIQKVLHPDENYSGPMGEVEKLKDRAAFHFRYGDFATGADAMGIEEPRLAQAQAQQSLASQRLERQKKLEQQQKELMDTAGSESGKAALLRGEIPDDMAQEKQQRDTDSYVAGLHNQSVNKAAGQNAATTAAVEKFTNTVIGGLSDVHGIFISHQKQLDDLRKQLQNQRNRTSG